MAKKITKIINKVKIVEVGLRDGLQNEKELLSLEDRYDLYEKLVSAGLKNIEVGAFVSPKWVPQMALSKDLVGLIISEKNKINNSVLVPNEQGMLEAIHSGITEVALFAASSETFSKKNINCSIAESFKRFEKIMKLAKEHNIKVRGYLSTCFGCPYEGIVSEAKVVKLAKKLYALGCYEISIGDTIGIAKANQVTSLFNKLKKKIPVSKLAGHFHDTRGQALVNVLQAYKCGVKTFDSSIGGLGGCPYAQGASGNVSTEDLVYMFEGMGIKTNLKLPKLVETHAWLQTKFSKKLESKVGQAGLL